MGAARTASRAHGEPPGSALPTTLRWRPTSMATAGLIGPGPLTHGTATTGPSRAPAKRKWEPIDDGRFALRSEDRCLQYRAIFHSDNGDRYPVLDRVAITLRR